MKVPEDQFSLSDKAFARGSPRERLPAYRRHGFTHIHFSYAWTFPEALTKAEVEDWKAALAESGMKVLDSHGCHNEAHNLWDPDAEARNRAIERFRHRLDVTAALGGDSMVYHVPTRIDPSPAAIRCFREGLARVEDDARERGIIIALENHYDAEIDKRALTACFEHFSEESVRFTFDPGHALISGNMEWLLKNACERLHVLHLNDNNAKEDLHQVPFRGEADWESIARAIAGSPYNKPLQMELQWNEGEYESYDDLLSAAAEAIRTLARDVNAAAR